MKRVLVLLVLVCLIVSCNVFGNTAFVANGSSEFKTLVVPKNGQTDLHSNEPLIQFQFQAVTDNITINDIGVSVNNSALISTASVSIKKQNNNDTLNFFLDSLSDNIIDNIMNKGASRTFTVASGDIVTVIINAKVSASAVPSNRLELKVHSIGSTFGSSSFNSYAVDKTATVNVSGFQGVTVNSVVSDSKILAGHANFPVLNVEVGPMVGEGLDLGLSVVVEKNSDDIINGVKLCFDVDQDKVIDGEANSVCGDPEEFSENRATPNLNKDNILIKPDDTTNVLVVYDLSTSTPNRSLSKYKAEVTTVLGTGGKSKQEISETISGSANPQGLDLVGVLVNKIADTPTGNVIPGRVTNDMLIIAVDSVGVTINVAKLKIGNGQGVEFGRNSNEVESIHIFDGTSLISADAFTSAVSEATVTLNKRILSGDDTNFTIQYVLPGIDEGKIVQAVVKDTSEFQVTVNGTAYIANNGSGTENFKVFNLPISSEERLVSDVDDKVVLRSVTPKTNDLVFVGQQSVPIFDLDILNHKQEPVVAELTVNANNSDGSSGFSVENQGIVGISVLNDSGKGGRFLSVSDSDSKQIIQFSVPKNSRETYTVGVNVGQDPDAVKNYTLRLDSIQSGIDVVKLEDIGKTTNFSAATYNIEVSFDSFIDNVATVTVTNNTGAPVTLNRVSLSAFEDGLGGNVVALRVTPSENVVILAGNKSTILLSVDAVLNAEPMDVVFLPIIEATVSGNAVLLSRYRAVGKFTSPFQTHTRGISQSFSANTAVDPSMVHIDRIEVKKDDNVIGEFLNGDAVTPNSEFIIHMRNPSLWKSVQLESVSAPHSGSDQDYDAEKGQLATRTFKGSGSFSLRVTPTDGSPFSIPIRFLMSRSLAVSDPLLYPNPYNTGGGSPLTMSINTTTPSDVEITVYDMRGRAVVAHNHSVPLGYTNVTIPGTGQLASGMYIAYVVIKSNGESVKKVVRLAVY